MNILIYKRTHTGDPSESGVFGVHDCMGQVRNFNFDAVIGVGGISAEPRANGIAWKVNWVGRREESKQWRSIGTRGPIIRFKPNNFRLMEDRGPLLEEISPLLAKAVYGKKNRFLFSSLTPKLKREAERVIDELLGNDHYSAASSDSPRIPGGCGPRRCRPKNPPIKSIGRPSRNC